MITSPDKVIVGYTEKRGWNIGSLQIEINRAKDEAMVSEFGIARPGGKRFKFVSSCYNSEGHERSEIIIDDQTALEFNHQHVASDFLG